MTTTHPLAARHASTGDRGALTGVLAAAFRDDPTFTWIFPDPAALEQAIVPSFEIYARVFARHEATRLVEVDGAVAGVAMWAPPGETPVHPDDEAFLSERVAELLARDELERMGELVAAFEAAHPEEPCWYLQFLGVDPARQQQGLGSLLLQDVLAGADERGEPAYLEATTARNRLLYERHGFVCTGEIVLSDGPTCYSMWRAPR